MNKIIIKNSLYINLNLIDSIIVMKKIVFTGGTGRFGVFKKLIKKKKFIFQQEKN